jgi:hypothetical protein
VRAQTKVLLILAACLLLWFAGIELAVRFGLVQRLLPYLTGQYEVAENSLLSFYFLVRVCVAGFLLTRWRTLNDGMRLAAAASAYGVVLTVAFIKIDVFSLRLSELVAIFDCICIAYVFAKWYERQQIVATGAAIALGAVFYISALKIVNDYSFAS